MTPRPQCFRHPTVDSPVDVPLGDPCPRGVFRGFKRPHPGGLPGSPPTFCGGSDLFNRVSDTQGEPKLVSVERKLRATGTIKTDGPEHGHPVIIIELILHVNEEKYVTLFLRVLLL